MEPVGRLLLSNPADLNAFRLRHSEYFNANPFMITLILGAVARMEERLLDGDSITLDDIARFKSAVAKASGSVGDRFFWRSLRPFGLMLGILWTVLFGIWGVVLFLAVFNIPNLVLRWRWLTRGYHEGPKAVLVLRSKLLDRSVGAMERFGSVMAACIAVVYLPVHGFGWTWSMAGAVVVFLVSAVLLSRKGSHSYVFPVGAVLATTLSVVLQVMG